MVRWDDIAQEALLLPMRGPGPEFQKVLNSKFDRPGGRLFHHDVSLDRLLTLVGAGWGILLALEGATGATYSGVTFRELHDADGAVRLNFSAYWHGANNNPSLRSFLVMLRERYPDLSDVPNLRQ
jgi:DNA-binding transcriptional LysR family regulator